MAAEHDSPTPDSRARDNGPSPRPIDLFLRRVQYLYVLVLLLTFIACAAWYSVHNAKWGDHQAKSRLKGPGGKPLPASSRNKCKDAQRKLGPRFGSLAKNVFRYLAAVIFLTYLASGASMFVHAFWHEDPHKWARHGLPWAGEWSVVHVTGSTFFYLYILFSLFDWRKGPNVVHFLIWILAFMAEVAMAVATYLAAADCHFVRSMRFQGTAVANSCIDHWTKIDLILYFVRILHLLSLIGLFCATWVCKLRACKDRTEDGEASESTPLLQTADRSSNQPRTSRQSSHYSDACPRVSVLSDRPRSQAPPQSDPPTTKDVAHTDEPAAFYRPTKLPHRTWWEYLRGYSIFFPYLWPRDSTLLQLHVLLCFGLVILQRLVNVAVPYQIGHVVNRLELAIRAVHAGESLTIANFPLRDFLLLGGLWILQGQTGLLGSLRSMLWIPVSQYSYKSLTTAAFGHVHSLSLDFHLSKRTGEVLSALNKGSAINQFLEQITFQVVPMLFDLFLSISVFYYRYGPLYAEINLVDTFWYLYMTVKMASTRAEQRREMTNADRDEEAVKNDSISSYETVKYFNAEEYESRRYRSKVGAFQAAEAKVQLGMVMMNICQTLVFNLGRIIAAVVSGWQVAEGVRTTGDWFTIVSYLTQLQAPLNFFGSFYRTVQTSMISGERLLELFKIQPTIVNSPHALPLTNFSGHVRWNNVSFSYDRRKPALRNVSFDCPPGTTTAFVGESGGGKSTLFRHMFRYYDCDSGSIEFDGKNVKDLTVSSLRSQIGVVPQDTSLFNESLMYNLKYANPDATDEQVHEACKAASIHDRILSFPDKYETMVGERGLKLSGGEKQRVAIARTILKNPRIIMLDEATSALDTHTEQEIQENVWTVGKGRTLFAIAHRLSTITHADQIIVLHAGEVVEKGTHEELLAVRGRYATMWDKQVKAAKELDCARSSPIRSPRSGTGEKAQLLLGVAADQEVDCKVLGDNGTLTEGDDNPGAEVGIVHFSPAPTCASASASSSSASSTLTNTESNHERDDLTGVIVALRSQHPEP